MSPSIQLTAPPRAIEGLGDLQVFAGLFRSTQSRTSNRDEKEAALRADGKDLLTKSVELLSALLLSAIDKNTKREFQAERTKTLESYMAIQSAITVLTRVLIPPKQFEQEASELLTSLENELRHEGAQRFGQDARDQALFTVWTLRKIAKLLSEIRETRLSQAHRSVDQKLAEQFFVTLTYAQFHLDCLVIAMERNRMIRPDVLEEICDGLRGAVNAYGFVRQGVDLRRPRFETPPTPAPEFDEEDRELLDSSMEDMAAESVGY